MTSTNQSLSTRGVHADHSLATDAVAADISTTTTFRHPDPDVIADYDKDWDPASPSRHVYSREGQPTVQRAEAVLSSLIGHPTILFPSGISAFFALLLHHNPDVIAFGTKEGPGYHGCHAAIQIFSKTKGEDRVTEIYMDDEFPNDGRKVLMWLETPLNPFGTSFSIEHYAKKVHAIPGGILGVDSTFAPPGIQDPFSWGADIVMHSATKYLAGHSDALVGTLSVRSQDEWRKLWNIRTYTGSNSGSLDTWLLLRSLRTFHVRTTRQFKTASLLVKWLESLIESNHSGEEDGTKGMIKKVWHTSLQDDAKDLIAEDGSKQMTSGPACFSVLMTKEIYAEWLGSKLQLFFNATSLGGVESLVEQRKVSDPHCDPCLVRFSIGLEDLEDLKADFVQAFKKIVEIEKEKASNDAQK